MTNELLEEIKRLRALADTGLLYAQNEYDKERYIELREISFRLLHTFTDHPVEALKLHLPLAKEYPTAKVDIRGFMLSEDNKLLLVQESADGRWSLPGGWADVGFTPSEIIIKEIKEETGLDARVDRLLAVFDKRKHPHPPQPFYVYKLVFYCKVFSGQISKGFDVLDVQYFDITNLPPLSEDRILKSQIELLYRKVTAADGDTYFD
jgi:ADP-ribose pyrophosphatase YjhB (NUDIX family)